MALLTKDLPCRVRESFEKAGLNSHQALLMESADLRRLVNLTPDDIDMLKAQSAEQLVANKFQPAAELQCSYLSTGCKLLDEHLGGGFARRGITEVAGESGTGKTQLCLQAALSVQQPPHAGGVAAGAVYICTEDTFPSSRLQQLLQLWSGTQHSAGVPAVRLSDNIFIEHIPDAESLQNCVSVRLPNLLHQRQIGLIVVDSIAGPFRADYDLRQGAVARAQILKNIGQQLHVLANSYNLAVICVNQVTAVPGEQRGVTVPALGLVWANLVTTRCQLHRTGRLVPHPIAGSAPVAERVLEIVFCPYLAMSSHSFVVTENGVQGLTKPAI